MATKRKATEVREYTLADILVTAGGVTKTLEEWQGSEVEAATTTVRDSTGHKFEYDDVTGHPRNVVVYTAGR